ncbi:transcriptional regulator [Bifidobacterium anseris]|uniref:Transcriptional regulator n=1 Tax=Bifidobacterium anseris TaxID=2020963 RepID=A0A2N5J1N5_9BIFI|nr:LCP family protein [Bifidobacterium anseris]PLS28113.1 transcriptional regulator [Bifidobacterium anseris]
MSNTDDPTTPPSFAPSPRRRRDADGATPRTTSDMTPDAVPAAPPSFAPHARTASTGSSRPSSTHPASIPPRTSGRRTTSERRVPPPTAASSASTTSSTPSGARARTATASSGGVAVARRRHPHRARRIVVAILATLLAIALIGGLSVWHWVDSGLRRADWLTDTPSGPATSWLILGSDERDGTTGQDGTTGERTDTILVLTKPKNGPSSLISIPRDSLVEVDGALSKINAVLGLYGRKPLVAKVEDITGQKIDHVAKINFGGLTTIVDALGGVELCYDQDVDDEKSEMHWKAGCHVVDGKQALAFSRMRYSDPQGDFGRAQRQRQVIGAIAKKAASPSTLLNIPKLTRVGDAAMAAISVDDQSTPATMARMLLAFRDASGAGGITGTVYWTDPDYYVDGVGSSVLLDDARNTELFSQLVDGTHKAGVVGTQAEQQG